MNRRDFMMGTTLAAVGGLMGVGRAAAALLNITGAFGARVHGLVIAGIRKASKPVHGILLDNPTEWSKKEDTLVFDDVKVISLMHRIGDAV